MCGPVLETAELICINASSVVAQGPFASSCRGDRSSGQAVSLTCCPSVPSAVTMATECVPAEEMTASWAGTVMVVPSCVTMVMVLPMACMSAWEMFTCNTQQLLRQGRGSELPKPHSLCPTGWDPTALTFQTHLPAHRTKYGSQW